MALLRWSRDEVDAFKTAVQQLTDASSRSAEAASRSEIGAVTPVSGSVTFNNASPVWMIVRVVLVLGLVIAAVAVAMLALFDFAAVANPGQLNRIALRTGSVDGWLVAGLIVAFLLVGLVFGMGYGQVEMSFSIGAEDAVDATQSQSMGGAAGPADDGSEPQQPEAEPVTPEPELAGDDAATDEAEPATDEEAQEEVPAVT